MESKLVQLQMETENAGRHRTQITTEKSNCHEKENYHHTAACRHPIGLQIG